jgi:phage gp45-like
MRNKISDLQIPSDKLYGFYRGVVEDNNDPEKRGRLKIRIFGIHSASKVIADDGGIATEDLIWSEPALPITEGSQSGFGVFSVPLKGSHVFLFFEGGNPLSPRYFASSPGVPTQAPSPKEGFNDPDGVYPTKHRLEEPDYHRLMRGETSKTVVEDKTAKLKKDVPVAGGETWNEPNPMNATEYPHNIVFATHGGIQVEVDSTPNQQRIHIYHPSNTYIEIGPKGDVVIRNDGDKTEIVMQNKKILVNCSEWKTIGKARKLKVGLDEFKEVGGNASLTIDGNYEIKVKGDLIFSVDGNVSVRGKKRVGINGLATVINSKEPAAQKSLGKLESVVGNSAKAINGDEKKAITGTKDTLITGRKKEKVVGNVEEEVTGNSEEKVTGIKRIQASIVYIN